jgi:hypothetical protein
MMKTCPNRLGQADDGTTLFVGFMSGHMNGNKD